MAPVYELFALRYATHRRVVRIGADEMLVAARIAVGLDVNSN
jgi:hypothetical protein